MEICLFLKTASIVLSRIIYIGLLSLLVCISAYLHIGRNHNKRKYGHAISHTHKYDGYYIIVHKKMPTTVT